ncbi:MAG: hypothetical protein HOW97_08115 [Catenulispora sp.]|nr:hypothetical protein [Catenulispora sp.]
MRDPETDRLYKRPLARAHALAEQWTGDLTPITRSQAAELLYTVLDPSGWAETDQATPTLTVVPAASTVGEQPHA